MKLDINFLQTGGVPLTNDLMANIMDAMKLYDVLGDVTGNFTILSGCEPVAGSTTVVSAGVVVINGEVLPFEGGSIFNKVYIHTEDVYKTFEDQTSKLLVKKKTVKFGSAVVEYNWADFTRITTLKDMMDIIEDKQDQIDDLNFYFDNLLAQFNTHLANTSNPHAVTAEQIGILKRGSIYIGDVQGKSLGWSYSGGDYTVSLVQKSANTSAGGDDSYSVVFNSALPTANYMVLGSFKFANWNNDNDLIYAIGNKTVSGFEIAIREVSQNVQNVYFEYLIIQL